MDAQPVLVEATRGPEVESRHHVLAAVCDAAGALVAGWGAVRRPVFPRSAVKPLQALPLIETGAAERFRLSDREIALACASHAGEPGHVAAVAAWLEAVGLSAADLECGAHWPSDAEAARALARMNEAPSPLHNNCSGKHCGFLATARHLDEPTAGYIRHAHPVQRRVAQTLDEMTGAATAAAPRAVDGCGIPTFALPLADLATGMARLADPSRLGPARAAACAQVRQAMVAHPWLISGTARGNTEILLAAPQVVAKGGAEGVYAAALPTLGLGVAVKVEDGAARAAEVALLAVLDRLGALDDTQRAALAARLRPPVRNVAGHAVGEIRAVL